MTTESTDETQTLGEAIGLHQAGKLQDAAAIYHRLLAQHPTHFDALYFAGAIALQTGEIARGIDLLHRAIAADPGNIKASLLLASGLRTQHRHAEAVAVLDGMLAVHPDSAQGHLHRAYGLQELKRLDEALASYDRSLTLDATNPDAHVDRSHCLLLLGRLEEGYAEYEWRKKLKVPVGTIQCAQPPWLGDTAIGGKTILLYAEQGFGDTILYSRYARRVAEAGGRVILAVQPPLVQLMRTLDPAIDVRPTTDFVTGFDTHCALMSLPHAFRTSAQTVPANVPYLAAEPERVAKWKQRIGTNGFRIGILWQGSRNKIDAGRSFPLTMFRALMGLADVRLISLQMHDGTEQLAALPEGMAVETLGAEFDAGPDAFLDTAAAMQNLDLVITSDTAAAHLAGALARPTWVALKYIAGSLWGAAGSTTAWYPTARLFRQASPGDWAGVFSEISDALRARLIS